MKSVGVFTDVSNLYYCLGIKYEGRRLSYEKYLEKCLNNNMLYRAFAYVSQSYDDALPFLTCLKYLGYEVKCKEPENNKRVQWEMSLAMDVIRVLDKLDVVVIGSSNKLLIPLIDLIKERGRQCVIFACGLSREMKDHSDFFAEITEDLLEDETT